LRFYSLLKIKIIKIKFERLKNKMGGGGEEKLKNSCNFIAYSKKKNSNKKGPNIKGKKTLKGLV